VKFDEHGDGLARYEILNFRKGTNNNGANGYHYRVRFARDRRNALLYHPRCIIELTVSSPGAINSIGTPRGSRPPLPPRLHPSAEFSSRHSASRLTRGWRSARESALGQSGLALSIFRGLDPDEARIQVQPRDSPLGNFNSSLRRLLNAGGVTRYYDDRDEIARDIELHSVILSAARDVPSSYHEMPWIKSYEAINLQIYSLAVSLASWDTWTRKVGVDSSDTIDDAVRDQTERMRKAEATLPL